MSRKAIAIAILQKIDMQEVTEIKDTQDAIEKLLVTIEAWEKKVVPNTSAGIVQPDPAAPVISTVPDPSDDLLTVP
jgi:hypothetical protein